MNSHLVLRLRQNAVKDALQANINGWWHGWCAKLWHNETYDIAGQTYLALSFQFGDVDVSEDAIQLKNSIIESFEDWQ